jgi:hypothetical protein
METASWRHYRRHLIIARTTWLGARRYDVWRRGQLIGTFRSTIEAELHVDSLDPSETQANW